MQSLTKKQKHTLITLGKAIRGVRLSKGMTRQKLAVLANVDRSNVGRIERGEINVRVRTLARIANALNISITKLLQKARL